MNRLGVERRAQIIQSLVESNSIRATCHMVGVCKDAVLKLIRDMGWACKAHHDKALLRRKLESPTMFGASKKNRLRW